MKKKNLKSLSLNKKVISNFDAKIKGGTVGAGEIRESSNQFFLCEAQCFSVPCI